MPALSQDGTQVQFALKGSLKRSSLTPNFFNRYGNEKRARPHEYSPDTSSKETLERENRATRGDGSVGSLSMQERLRLASSESEASKTGSQGSGLRPSETQIQSALDQGTKFGVGTLMRDQAPAEAEPVPISMRAEFPRPGTGLANLGNTCYLNSVLQCLLHTPPLYNFLRERLHSEHCEFRGRKPADGFCPVCLLESRLRASFSDDFLNRTRPLLIAKSLPHLAPQLSIGDQEDAHELLRLMIDACHRTCLLQQRGLPLSALKRFEDRTGKVPTVISDIFGGLLQSQVKCLTCGAESNKRDIFMDLSLDIGSSIHSVNGALQAFVLPETLEGSNRYRCEKCKQLSRARKQMQVLRAPNVLVLQLKRFENGFGGKITKHIHVNETLKLSGVMAMGVKEPQPEYTLYALIVHEGSTQQSGHYYAFAHVNRCWYEFNDANVSPVSWASVSRRGAYILFYIKNQPRGQVLFYPPKMQGAVDGESHREKAHAARQAGPQLQDVHQGTVAQQESAGAKTDNRGEKSETGPVYGPQLPLPGSIGKGSIGKGGNSNKQPIVAKVAGPSSSFGRGSSSSVGGQSSAVRISSVHAVEPFSQIPPNHQQESSVSQAVTEEGSSQYVESLLATAPKSGEPLRSETSPLESRSHPCPDTGSARASEAHANGPTTLHSNMPPKLTISKSESQAVGTAGTKACPALQAELVSRKRKGADHEDLLTRREVVSSATEADVLRKPLCEQNGLLKSSAGHADTSSVFEVNGGAVSARGGCFRSSQDGVNPAAPQPIRNQTGASEIEHSSPGQERSNDGASAAGGRVELLVEASEWSMALPYDSDEDECNKRLTQISVTQSGEKVASSQGLEKEMKQLPGLLEAEALLKSGPGAGVSSLLVRF